mmetsp:Transcript_17651/g.28746  ORF Transcript_17651/g.28746 Transcript_17651/m.28746 type:complete len:94 (+) Transcript_17651:779-1060(+)
MNGSSLRQITSLRHIPVHVLAMSATSQDHLTAGKESDLMSMLQSAPTEYIADRGRMPIDRSKFFQCRINDAHAAIFSSSAAATAATTAATCLR